MKRWISFALALICLLGLVGCSNSMNYIINTKPSVTGVVTEIHTDYIILYAEHAEGYPYGSTWQISLHVENQDSYTSPSVGDEVIVYHNGSVMESDPLRVGKVYAITLKTPVSRADNENP